MVKLTKDITGCSGGEIYPRTYEAGTDCPDDLLAAAIELGAVSGKAAAKAAEEAEAARLAAEEAERKAAEEAEAARLAAEAEQDAATAAERKAGK